MTVEIKTVLRFVITNVPKEHEKTVIEALIPLIQKGIIDSSDVHYMAEGRRVASGLEKTEKG